MATRPPPRPPQGTFVPSLTFLLAAVGAVAPVAADPLANLRSMYPDVRAKTSSGRTTMVYGAPMTPGVTPDDAAQRFWNQHGTLFRGTQPELVRRWAAQPKESNKTIIAYHQTIRGVPVEGANARVMVTSASGLARVNFVSAQLAGEPLLGSENPIIPAQLAAIWVQTQPGYGTISIVGQPERVVLLGSGERPDAWAWKVRTRRLDSLFGEPRTFFVNTADMQILDVREGWVAARGGNGLDVQLVGKATPLAGNLPHTSSNPPVDTPLPHVRVGWSEVGQGVWNDQSTHRDGTTWFNAGSHTQVDVRAILGQSPSEAGLRVVIMDYQDDRGPGSTYYCDWNLGQSAAQAQAQATAPGTLNLSFTGDDEFTVAQMNAVVHFARSRDYILDRIDIDVDLLPDLLRVAVNLRGDFFWGGAFYQWGCGDSVPTFGFSASYSAQGARNATFSSNISHEYGHYVLHKLINNPAGAFGEGFADVYWILLSGDPVFGREWRVGDPFIRHPIASGCQYGDIYQPECPCDFSGGHTRGQVLGRIWTDIMDRFVDEDPEEGLERARKLHTTWMLLTQGYTPVWGYVCESAFEDTVVEVLSADDDDSNLSNGTPNCEEIICPALSAANLPCEDLPCP